MKATRILAEKQVFKLKKDSAVKISVSVEIFKIPEPESQNFPEGLKISMVAYKSDDPEHKVLLDCHPPKGTHYHIGENEVSFKWVSLDETYNLFWHLLENEFGEIEEEII